MSEQTPTHLRLADQWQDYECLDAGDGEKLERWGTVILRRPDPQALWPKSPTERRWNSPHAHYHRSAKGGGAWSFLKPLPASWTIGYRDLRFKVAPTDFKHTGLFPEQASNWDWMAQQLHAHPNARVLNLFAYTGGATLACAHAGAQEVVHVDASKGMIQWAKENQDLSHLNSSTIRFLVDDALKFVEREHRRGRRYHGIVLDPPSYGRGPNNELWKLEDSLAPLLSACAQLLADDAAFFLLNAYTTGLSHLVLNNLLQTLFSERSVHIETGELGLPLSARPLILPCGIYGRVSFK